MTIVLTLLSLFPPVSMLSRHFYRLLHTPFPFPLFNFPFHSLTGQAFLTPVESGRERKHHSLTWHMATPHLSILSVSLSPIAVCFNAWQMRMRQHKTLATFEMQWQCNILLPRGGKTVFQDVSSFPSRRKILEREEGEALFSHSLITIMTSESPLHFFNLKPSCCFFTCWSSFFPLSQFSLWVIIIFSHPLVVVFLFLARLGFYVFFLSSSFCLIFFQTYHDLSLIASSSHLHPLFHLVCTSLFHSDTLASSSFAWLCLFKREDGMRENGYPDFCLPCVWCEGCDVVYLSLGRDFPFSSHHHWCVGVDEEKSEKPTKRKKHNAWTTEGEKYNLLQMLKHLSWNLIVLLSDFSLFSHLNPHPLLHSFLAHLTREHLFTLSIC